MFIVMIKIMGPLSYVQEPRLFQIIIKIYLHMAFHGTPGLKHKNLFKTDVVLVKTG